jgi:hypothetical protein
MFQVALKKAITLINLNATHLKIIACLSMWIDHVGIMLYPHIIALRMVGRLAYPIFAFQLVIGRIHTSNKKKYYIRLTLLALISQIPYMLTVGDGFKLNIIFPFLMALGCIELYEKKKVAGVLTAIILVGVTFQNPYIPFGTYGILTILLFHLTTKSKMDMVAGQTFLNVLYDIITASIQPLAILATPFIYLYNGEIGNKNTNKVLYWFYPTHLIVLYFLSKLI